MYRKLDPDFPARTAIKKGGTAYMTEPFIMTVTYKGEERDFETLWERRDQANMLCRCREFSEALLMPCLCL